MRIIAIIGPAGAGKHYARCLFAYELRYKSLPSHTDRLGQKGESEGREHSFGKKLPSKEEILAHTYTDYTHVWYTHQQVKQDDNYVISGDEKMLLDLVEEQSNYGYDLIKIYIDCSDEKKKERGVSDYRHTLDDNRYRISEDFYDYVIDSNGTNEELYESVKEIVNNLKQTKRCE